MYLRDTLARGGCGVRRAGGRHGMSHATRLMAGLILVLVPTLQFVGYFLLTSPIDRDSGYMANALRQNFFRAGHAHAGVITLLSLICQPFVDATRLSPAWRWVVRIGVARAGNPLSAGFFFFLLFPPPAHPDPATPLLFHRRPGPALLVRVLGDGG